MVALRRAGLLHDLGWVGVSAGIWGKSGPLTEGEWERAIVQGFCVWREIKKRGAGTLVINLDERSIVVKGQ